MSFSIGQVERESGEYIEIVTTGVALKEGMSHQLKDQAYKCYENVVDYLIKLYERFQLDESALELMSVNKKVPNKLKGSIYSKEVLALDKHGDYFIAVYLGKRDEWYDSVRIPLGKIEKITHWMPLPRSKRD